MGKFGKEINQKFASKLGQVLFSIFKDDTMNFVIGRDTRENAYQIEKALAQVLQSLGANVFLLGTTSTPGVSYATRAYKATAGIMVTGSSKPKDFIGFKIFNGNGFKISDEQLSAIKFKFKNLSTISGGATKGKVYYKPYFNFEYINFLKQFSKIDKNANSLKILADLSCGSAEELYEEFCLAVGIKSFLNFGTYDSDNVNLSFTRARLFDKTNNFKTQDAFGKIKNHKNFFDFKVVFDADCDKVIFFDKMGNKIDNEKLILLFAKIEKLENRAPKVVLGPMVNSALVNALEEEKIETSLVQENISQKTLIHKALEENASICGDNFGNLIFLDYAHTSDAFLTVLKFLNIYVSNRRLVEEVFAIELNKRYVKKIKINSRINLDDLKEIIDLCEFSIIDRGKIFIKHDKFLNEIEIHLETNEPEIKKEIFSFLESFLKLAKS